MDWLKPGTKASDYKCPACGFWYQLKSKKSPIGRSIRDGAYSAMMEAIREDRAPSYFFLHYDLATWSVCNLLLVPSFAFPPSAIIKCPPLSPTAQRAGWVGCNFDLSRVPADARIEIISTRSSGRESAPSNQSRLTSAATIIVPSSEVREKFKRVKPLKELSVKERGWTLDVLNIVRRLVEERGCPHPQHLCQTQRHGKVPTALDSPRAAAGDSRAPSEFTNKDIYAHARELEHLHPDNRHIRDKIRQQLQVLRDAGLLIHVERSLWRLP